MVRNQTDWSDVQAMDPSINSVPPDGWAERGEPSPVSGAAQGGQSPVSGAAQGVHPHASAAPSVTDLDMLYKETDSLYIELARGSGLSVCAYWIMYAIEVEGGSATQRQVIDRIYYAKQTVNSAVRSLEGKGLVRLTAAEGGDRRSKVMTLTDAGRAFARRHIEPAMQAEARAFRSLGAEKAAQLVRLANEYARAVHAEVVAMGALEPELGA